MWMRSQVNVEDYKDNNGSTPYLNEIRHIISPLHSLNSELWYCDTVIDLFMTPFDSSERFKKKGKKWYNCSDEQAAAEWDKAMRDSSVPKQIDQFGNTCVAKLSTRTISTGCRVGTERSIVEDNKVQLKDANDPAELRKVRDGTWPGWCLFWIWSCIHVCSPANWNYFRSAGVSPWCRPWGWRIT